MQINHTLVNPHLEAIPRLGTLTARRFPGGDAQRLRRHTHRPLHTQLLLPRLGDEVRADLLQGTHVARGQRDTDAVDGCGFLAGFLGILLQIRLKQNFGLITRGAYITSL